MICSTLVCFLGHLEGIFKKNSHKVHWAVRASYNNLNLCFSSISSLTSTFYRKAGNFIIIITQCSVASFLKLDFSIIYLFSFCLSLLDGNVIVSFSSSLLYFINLLSFNVQLIIPVGWLHPHLSSRYVKIFAILWFYQHLSSRWMEISSFISSFDYQHFPSDWLAT